MGGFSIGNNNFQGQAPIQDLANNTALGVVTDNIKNKKKRPSTFTINTKDKDKGGFFGSI